jgi:hypothetical protein
LAVPLPAGPHEPGWARGVARGQETGHKHDENSGQPQDFRRNAGDHELRTSNNLDCADVKNEQKMR